jgi:hypothetical protein
MAKRFQFSIRWLLAVTAIVGVALAALSAKPNWISGGVIQLIFLMMPGLVAILLVVGRGNVRAFAIGALVPALIGVPIVVWFLIAGGLQVAGSFPPYTAVGMAEYLFGRPVVVMRVFAIFIWSATLFGGTAAVVIRWLVGTTPNDT